MDDGAVGNRRETVKNFNRGLRMLLGLRRGEGGGGRGYMTLIRAGHRTVVFVVQ